MPDITDLTPTPPTHPGGCPCKSCDAERAAFEEAAAILREAGEIA